MAISFSTALKAYQTAASAVAESGGGGGAVASGAEAVGFGDVLKAAMGAAEKSLSAAESSSVGAIAGKADLTSMMQDITQAELLLEAIVSVRDKTVAAYDKITSMNI
ncbi:hypothetical protein FACS1894186_6660 [Alphaproteobacteria bacterium]|nr:hypothetical protein FACS1894186_6660 [Alphaproteobacteria bacterium]